MKSAIFQTDSVVECVIHGRMNRAGKRQTLKEFTRPVMKDHAGQLKALSEKRIDCQRKLDPLTAMPPRQKRRWKLQAGLDVSDQDKTERLGQPIQRPAREGWISEKLTHCRFA
jgi:hypothetical protein